MDSKQGIQDLPLEQQQKIASCREAVLRAPDDPQAHSQLAEAYLMADKVDLALGELETAAELQPHSASIHYQLGKLRSHLGQDDLAETAYRVALACDAKFYQASLALAELLACKKMVNEAIHILEESLQHSPDSEDLHWFLPTLYYARGDKECAIQVLEESLRILPKSRDLHEAAGFLYRMNGDYDRSLAAFRIAAQLDPTNAHLHAETALALYHLQCLDEAEVEARQALQIEPEHADALHYLGWILHQQERLSEAAEVLEEAIALRPGERQVYTKLAHVLDDMGEPARALSILQSGLAVIGEHPLLYAYMGGFYFDLGEPDAALKALARAIELEPSNELEPFLYAKMAYVYEDLGESDEAFEALTRAIELAPNKLDLRITYGMLLSCEGRHEEAIREYAHVLTVEPDREDVLTHLTRSLYELGFLQDYIDGEPEEQRPISEIVQEEVKKQLELQRHEMTIEQRPAYVEAPRLPVITGYIDQWLEDAAGTNRKSKEIAAQLRVIAAQNDTIARHIFDNCRKHWFAQDRGSPGHDLMLDLGKPPRTLVEFGERIRLLRRYIDCFHAPGYRWGEDNLKHLRGYFDSIGFAIPDHALDILHAIRGVSNDFGRHVTNIRALTSNLKTLELSYPLEENPEAIHRAYLQILRKLAAAMQDILDAVSRAAEAGALDARP